MRMTADRLDREATDLGLTLVRWRMDGQSGTTIRYKFVDSRSETELYTARGMAAAVAWIRGYFQGIARGLEVPRGDN